MKIVIAGGTGLIGSAVARHLEQKGWEVVVLTRKVRDLPHGRAEFWDGESYGNWRTELSGAEAVINLSGYPIINRWTPKSIAKIESSRIGTTELIADAIAKADDAPKVWLNASAVGFYGDSGAREVTEASRNGDDYLGKLCQRWESACLLSDTPNTRKACLRFGVVIAPEGEFFKKTTMQTKAGLGSAVGTGKQYVSWIHIDDLVDLIEWCLKEPVTGPLNAVAPNPVTSNDLMAAFRKALRRPTVPNIPEFMIKAIGALIGIEPTILLVSTRAIPEIAMARGFRFKHEHIEPTIKAMVKDSPPSWEGA